MNPMNPGGPPPGYPPQGYPQQGAPQAHPQQGAPQAYPQGAPQGYPQGAPQAYPQQGAPQAYPQGAPQGYPQGAPQGYPQGAPQGYPQGAPQAQPPGAYPYPGQPAPPAAPMGAVMVAPMAAAPMAGANPYAQAQSSLKTAGSMLKVVQFTCLGVGVLMAISGVAMMATMGVMAGSSLLVSGIITGATGWFMVPKFMGSLGGATAMVDALAAKQQLAMTGIPAQGRLLSVQQTGAFINMNPQVQVVVEVQGPQGVYQTQTTAVVPQIAIPRFQPGATVQVRINPQNPHDVAVVV